MVQQKFRTLPLPWGLPRSDNNYVLAAVSFFFFLSAIERPFLIVPEKNLNMKIINEKTTTLFSQGFV